MARYRGPKLRIIRRLGELPGLTQKSCTKDFPPGQHGPKKKTGGNQKSKVLVHRNSMNIADLAIN